MDRKNQLLWRFFKINLAKVDDRNAWYLVLEIFWASILGSVATFNAAYAIRLGADNFQVSLLSSIPALVAVLVSFPAGVFLAAPAAAHALGIGQPAGLPGGLSVSGCRALDALLRHPAWHDGGADPGDDQRSGQHL